MEALLPAPRQLGTFLGVFVPCTCTIFGVVVFLRLGFVVGQAGIWATLVIILASFGLCFLTTLSLCALISDGGAGIEENLWVGGTTNLGGITSVTDNSGSTASNNGALRVTGGAGIGQNLFVGGNLEVSGSVKGNGAYDTTSDRRYKTGIVQLQSALDTVKLLRGVKYRWRRDEFPLKNFTAGEQSGFIAQEVEALIPDAVHTEADGFKSLRMAYIIPYLVEATKLQDAAITGQAERIQTLEAQLQTQDESSVAI